MRIPVNDRCGTLVMRQKAPSVPADNANAGNRSAARLMCRWPTPRRRSCHGNGEEEYYRIQAAGATPRQAQAEIEITATRRGSSFDIATRRERPCSGKLLICSTWRMAAVRDMFDGKRRSCVTHARIHAMSPEDGSCADATIAHRRVQRGRVATACCLVTTFSGPRRRVRWLLTMWRADAELRAPGGLARADKAFRVAVNAAAEGPFCLPFPMHVIPSDYRCVRRLPE